MAPGSSGAPCADKLTRMQSACRYANQMRIARTVFDQRSGHHHEYPGLIHDRHDEIARLTRLANARRSAIIALVFLLNCGRICDAELDPEIMSGSAKPASQTDALTLCVITAYVGLPGPADIPKDRQRVCRTAGRVTENRGPRPRLQEVKQVSRWPLREPLRRWRADIARNCR